MGSFKLLDLRSTTFYFLGKNISPILDHTEVCSGVIISVTLGGSGTQIHVACIPMQDYADCMSSVCVVLIIPSIFKTGALNEPGVHLFNTQDGQRAPGICLSLYFPYPKVGVKGVCLSHGC